MSATLLDLPEIHRRLEGLRAWEYQDSSLRKTFTFKDFNAAVAFVNRVAVAAESQDHHPDIRLHGWNKVTLTISTHSAGGVTVKDCELAATIDSFSSI